MKSDCEACAVSVHLSQEEIDQLFDKSMRVRNVKTVTEEEYERRIHICTACEYLVYGTTCRQCGCIVQIKAKLSGARCPSPGGDAWA